MADIKRPWSYEQVHEIVRQAVDEAAFWDDWRPTLIICIAAGGFVPTRILRSCLKHRYGCNIPIQTIGLQLYDVDGCDPETSPVQRVQWLAYGTGPGQVLLQGHRILIVDEVDDSRKTLAHAVAELQADIAAERTAFKLAAAENRSSSSSSSSWQEPQLGVFVLHNKLRPKLAALPEELMRGRYWSGLDIPNCWCKYPWDAEAIYEHTDKAEAAGLPGRVGGKDNSSGSRAKRQSSGCPPVAAAHQQQQQQQHVANGAAAQHNGNGIANGAHALLNGA
ncbi:hypothetical protein OEZ85_002989 [Tetradesmus obliquus]|uniref:Phosphoribosyltransferase domain-containing protein n=1 Tax=Tetradesmus obliquus TaxID=3088 RepID=A0ABY8U033_TETOB|nr:hypothetical protein OEZ85_002989 [Tetradesmus obliquus]